MLDTSDFRSLIAAIKIAGKSPSRERAHLAIFAGDVVISDQSPLSSYDNRQPLPRPKKENKNWTKVVLT